MPEPRQHTHTLRSSQRQLRRARAVSTPVEKRGENVNLVLVTVHQKPLISLLHAQIFMEAHDAPRISVFLKESVDSLKTLHNLQPIVHRLQAVNKLQLPYE